MKKLRQQKMRERRRSIRRIHGVLASLYFIDTREERKLARDIRGIEKCCGITIADFDVSTLELNQICCTKCNRSLAFMECDGDLLTEWNKGVEV